MVESFAEIVRFDDRRHPTVDRSVRIRRVPIVHLRRTRRQFVRDAAAASAALGLMTLGTLPTARRAWASHAEDDMAPEQGAQLCGALGSWVDNDDCDGCNTLTCGGCCASTNWHKHGGSTGFILRPNQCDDSSAVPEGNWDGWKWKVNTCCPNGRKEQIWRCHDGWRVLPGDDEKTVCKFRTSAGTTVGC